MGKRGVKNQKKIANVVYEWSLICIIFYDFAHLITVFDPTLLGEKFEK